MSKRLGQNPSFEALKRSFRTAFIPLRQKQQIARIQGEIFPWQCPKVFQIFPQRLKMQHFKNSKLYKRYRDISHILNSP